MKYEKLFSEYKLGKITLKNRVVMSPMTRSRATGNIPNALMAEYYRQRSGAGLIITEGTSPSPNGLGYSRIPGIYTCEQVEEWVKVTEALHDAGGKIFVQLMHTGRIAHELNLPKGGKVIAPSAIRAAGQMWTDQKQLQDYPVPSAMTTREIGLTIKEYAEAARNAISAGFDGVELHGANGYLPEQFLSPVSNIRTDNYGVTIENRARFILEVIARITAVIGKDKTGIRISPYGTGGSMQYYPEIDDTYRYLAKELDKIGIAYIHIADHSHMGSPPVPEEIKKDLRELFGGTLILSGGYNADAAEADLKAGKGDLVSFGRPFLSNPDFVERIKNNWPVSEFPGRTHLYTPGEKGYTDYPYYDG